MIHRSSMMFVAALGALAPLDDWLAATPALALSAFVMAVFMISRAYEEVLNPRLRKA